MDSSRWRDWILKLPRRRTFLAEDRHAATTGLADDIRRLSQATWPSMRRRDKAGGGFSPRSPPRPRARAPCDGFGMFWSYLSRMEGVLDEPWGQGMKKSRYKS